jgi:tRNA (Thr-GGU) A37 N-methylase
VRLLRRKGRKLAIRGVDILNGTPLLDIKPYIPRFDCFPGVRCGWYGKIDRPTADRRGKRGYSGKKRARAS